MINKQEVIDEIESAIPDFILNDYHRGRETGLTYALELVNQLDEPEKPVVPQYVADWLEVCKDNLALSLANSMNNIVMRTNNQPDKTIHWLAKNSETFAKAWIYGYEVEKEKVYRARHKLTGEYLSQNYAKTGYYHGLDHFHILKLSKKDWEELGVWGSDMYEPDEVKE